MDFLLYCLEHHIEENVFSDVDGYPRGVKDGKAKEAHEIMQLLGGLRYDQ